MPPTKIAFFGATGDSAGHCLAFALKEGLQCIALARTPSKLTKSMQDKGVSDGVLNNQLTIIEGNAKDVEAVKRALRINDQIVDMIVSGIGGTPGLQASIFKPVVLTDPTICQDVGKTILEATSQIKSTTKPVFINISTTGIPPEGMPRDVPLAFVPLYHWVLQDPHEDKKVLESALREHVEKPLNERGISGFVNIKPSLLMDGDGKGLANIRQGIDEKPALGYTIARKDIGLWIFENVIKRDMNPDWMNKSVSLTN